ncbi:MAG: PqqD family protein [Breznakibacter sp.]
MVELKYVRAEGFVEKQVGDELILVPLVNQVANMSEVFTFNEVGAFIWHCLKTPLTLNQLAEKVVESFEVEKSIALNDVKIFLEQTHAKHVVTFA